MVEQLAADLACFLRAAQLAPTMQSEFALAKVNRVEAAWQVDTMDDATFGWVVAMRDGRRFYLQYTMEDAEAGRPEEFQVAALPADQAHPKLDREPGVHWYTPDHINQHLGRIRPKP
jgi:hypothetical protein